MPEWLRRLLPAFLEDFAERLSAPESFLWIVGLSVVMFLGTVFGVPMFLARLPEDYLHRRARREVSRGARLPRSIAQICFAILRNTLGLGLVLLGLLMLVLPGQGILTIVVGLMLLDFPGKYRLERWLLTRPSVLNAINVLRRRMKRPPFEPHPPHSP